MVLWCVFKTDDIVSRALFKMAASFENNLLLGNWLHNCCLLIYPCLTIPNSEWENWPWGLYTSIPLLVVHLNISLSMSTPYWWIILYFIFSSSLIGIGGTRALKWCLFFLFLTTSYFLCECYLFVFQYSPQLFERTYFVSFLSEEISTDGST